MHINNDHNGKTEVKKYPFSLTVCPYWGCYIYVESYKESEESSTNPSVFWYISKDYNTNKYTYVCNFTES